MTLLRPAAATAAATLAFAAVMFPAAAQTTSTAPAAKPAAAATAKPAAAKPAPKGKKPAAKPAAPPPPPEPDLPEANAEQTGAAERVYYGAYECEFNQLINIAANTKHFGYVDVKHGKADYVMKPVLSSTGAVRLEDVRGETLMVQIASKSMLLNVKTGQRLVDECINPKQREWIEASKAAKAAEAASAAAAGSAPAASGGPSALLK